jgi:hypothetical protein
LIPDIVLARLVAALVHDTDVMLDSGAVWIVLTYFIIAAFSVLLNTEAAQRKLSGLGGRDSKGLETAFVQMIVAAITAGWHLRSFLCDRVATITLLSALSVWLFSSATCCFAVFSHGIGVK